VERKQGEFVEDDVMTSITPHGVINNAHGHMMPHGRNHKRAGGSTAFIEAPFCALCEQMKNQVRQLRGTYIAPPELDMTR